MEALTSTKSLVNVAFPTIVFSSLLLFGFVLSFNEVAPANFPFSGIASAIRPFLAIYLLLFPTGYLLLSFLFPKEKLSLLERFGLSIALSISLNVIAILFANMLFAFPINFRNSLIILVVMNMVFYALFIGKEFFWPYLELAAVRYIQAKRALSGKTIHGLADIAFFSTLAGLSVILTDLVTVSGQAFNELSAQLFYPTAALFAFFPSGQLVLSTLMHGKEKADIGKLSGYVALISVSLFTTAFVAVGIAGSAFEWHLGFKTHLFLVMLLLTALNLTIYALFTIIARAVPLASHLVKKFV